MRMSKKEVNLRRLLAAAPNQLNQTKLIHYVTTSRELLDQIEAETNVGGISSISKAILINYSEKIEALAARLSVPEPEPLEVVQETSVEEIVSVSKNTEIGIYPTASLRRRTISSGESSNRNESAELVKLDEEAHKHIEMHRQLQNDLTDEMITLAKQLKESSLMMNKSLNETEKVLDSTEKAVEQSLASTGHANTRAEKIYSEGSKTTCFTWLIIFVMMSLFIMVVLLIRVT